MPLRAAIGLLAGSIALACHSGPTMRVKLPAIDPSQLREERASQYDRWMTELGPLQARADRIFERLLVSNAEFCEGEVQPILGIRVLAADDLTGFDRTSEFAMDLRESAERSLGVRDNPTVLSVDPNGAAAAAGVELLDEVLFVNGLPVGDAAGVAMRLEDASDGRVILEIERLSERVQIAIDAPMGCSFEVVVEQGRDLHASAYPGLGLVFLTRGVLDSFDSDDEVAIILGHELAHLVLGHAPRSRPKRERAADYVGYYLAERSGYSTADAAEVWRAFALGNVHSIARRQRTHDGMPERVALARATRTEITRKRQQGLPLLPEVE